MTLIDKAEALRIVMEECYKDREMKLAERIENRFAAIPARGVGVRPLVWEQVHAEYHVAETPFGAYEAGEDWYRAPDRRMRSRLADPTAAAQADYEARILSALSTTEEGK